jgi:hypothetical protein
MVLWRQLRRVDPLQDSANPMSRSVSITLSVFLSFSLFACVSMSVFVFISISLWHSRIFMFDMAITVSVHFQGHYEATWKLKGDQQKIENICASPIRTEIYQSIQLLAKPIWLDELFKVVSST